MTPEQIERNRQFLKDLRANPRKAEKEFRNRVTGGRCCLCVAYDSALEQGFAPEEKEQCSQDELILNELAEFYGWPCNNPVIKFGEKAEKASVWNDGDSPEVIYPLSHPQIADAFEQTFPKLLSPANPL